VTLFISVHNEEKVILRKIENSLALDYPREKLEIMIASDGSTDRTSRIVKEFLDRGVVFFESFERSGKNATINKYINRARGEIIIFTDANSFYMQDAVRKLVRNFFDGSVGCIVGKLKYVDEKTAVGKGEGLYFRYESMIKGLESRLGTVVAATGSIYAIRRELFTPLDMDVANDFAHPIQIAARGYKVVFEPEAIAYEQATSSIFEEFRRRARIVTRGFTAFGKYWRSYCMLRGMRGFCFVSHKLLRWFVPFFLIALFIANLFLLDSPFFKITFYAQLSFYIAAFLGIFIKGKKGKLFVIPFYFCMINLAALTGFINYLRGRRQAVWEVAKTTR
jgi:cellulose synthase/poly-beta-1,6-N-acetylglucosamine synthase-like glycosyltransferase